MLRILFFVFIPELLWSQINSPFDEQSPVLHPSTTELYFTIAANPLNVSGKRDPGDIWVSRKLGDTWSKPELVKGLVNNAGYNAVLGFSADGREMFLYGHYTATGEAAGSQGIAVSKRNGDVWSLPKNETIPYFINRSVGSGGHITSDKSIFVFSAEGRGHDSFGNEDIYVSFNRTGTWTEPLNLGNIVNSSYQELSPYYDEASKSLYFSSNKPGGNGSFDVYLSSRLDENWLNWSPPKQASGAVNTEGRELYFRFFENGYTFTSTLNSDGYGDVRQILNPITSADSAAPSIPVVEATPVQNDGQKLTGSITDITTGQGVLAKLEFKPHGPAQIVSSQSGQYQATLVLGFKGSVIINAPGYLTLEEPLVLPRGQQEIEINFTLQPIAVGVSVNLKHVLFRQSSPELLPESYDELDKVVSFLRQNPTVEIELAGHTDTMGSATLNLKLSRERVNRVKNYLVEKSISAKRISGVGYGGKMPIASNKTEEGRRQNRRVEFKIIKK